MNDQKPYDISVLYVEDEPSTRKMIAEILQRRVREVITARNGSDGLALFREHKPDLVVTDIRMPVMDGIRMAREIRAENKEALIIVTTAHSDSQFLLDAINIGIDQYVVKPVSLEKLSGVISKCAGIIDSRRVARQLHESETRFRAVFEHSVDAIGISKTGTHVFVNPAYLALFGYASNEELAGKPVLDLIAPCERPAILERIQQRAQGESMPSSYETRGLRKTGEEFVMDVHASTYELSGSTYTLVILRDITEPKKMEEALIQAKEEWERTFNAISDPIMILDTNFSIMKANKAMADALSVTPDRAIGLTCYESVHGTITPPEHCPHAKLVKDGQARSEEIFEPRLGGHYLITVSPLHAPDGTLVGSIHAARDISVMKKAEEMIIQYSQNLEQLLAISRETTMTADLKVLYRAFVNASKDLLGLDFSTLMLLSDDNQTLTIQDCLGFPESMIGHFSLAEGQGLSSLVVRNRRPETVENFAQETRFDVPAIVRQKNIRSALAVPMMMKDKVFGVLIGHSTGLRIFSRNEIDIYQHIANQAAVAIQNAMNMDIIRKSEKYVRDITASLGEGVYVLNANGETTFVNPEAEALLGWSEKELINNNIHDIVHNRKADGHPLLFQDCEMQKVIQTGNRFHSIDEQFVRKDGTVFPVSVHSTPLMEEGKVVASVTSFRDITETKRNEQERERLIADLQKALAEIKTLHRILPICSNCKKIRDEKGAWTQIEAYISKHTDTLFTHGICQDCAKLLYPEIYPEKGPLSEG